MQATLNKFNGSQINKQKTRNYYWDSWKEVLVQWEEVRDKKEDNGKDMIKVRHVSMSVKL